MVVVRNVGKAIPDNSIFSWKAAFRGWLFQAVIVVVVFLLVVVVRSGGRSNVEKQKRFRMEGSFSGIACSSSDSSGRFPTSSSRSSGGSTSVEKAVPEIAFSHGR